MWAQLTETLLPEEENQKEKYQWHMSVDYFRVWRKLAIWFCTRRSRCTKKTQEMEIRKRWRVKNERRFVLWNGKSVLSHFCPCTSRRESHWDSPHQESRRQVRRGGRGVQRATCDNFPKKKEKKNQHSCTSQTKIRKPPPRTSTIIQLGLHRFA